MSSIPAARSAPIVPFAERLYRPLEPYAYTLIRVATGAIFVPHGVLKLFFGGAGSALGYGLGVLELAGGLALALGILVRPIAALLIVDVLMVIAANIGKGWLWTRGGVQYHTFLLGMLLAVAIGGAGRVRCRPPDRELGARAGDRRARENGDRRRRARRRGPQGR